MTEDDIEFGREANTNTVAVLFGLSLQQARVLQCLMRHDVAPLDELRQIVPEPHLAIHRLKVTLGSNLALRNCRGIGYVVSAEAKQAVHSFYREGFTSASEGDGGGALAQGMGG